MEFRHLFSDIFNGLIATGLIIQGVWEDPEHLHHNADAEPGSYEHMVGFVQQYFAVVARKP